MKRLFILLVILALVGCAAIVKPPSLQPDQKQFKILTINLMGPVRYLEGRDKLALDLMEQYAPDVICFQEGLWGPCSLFFTQAWNSAAKMAKHLGMTYAYEKCWNNVYMCWYTAGLLSPWRLESVRTLRFKPPGSTEYHAAVIGRIGDVGVASCHLSTYPGIHEEQIIDIQQRMPATPYAIIAGDMNTTGDDITRRLANQGYQEVPLPGPTYGDPANPLSKYDKPKKIDRIFVKGFDIEQVEIVFTPPNHISDHYGVLVTLRKQ